MKDDSLSDIAKEKWLLVRGECGQLHSFVDGCWQCDRIAESKRTSAKELNVYEIETWNAAIEAVVKYCDEMGEEARISLNIRKLKK